MDGEQAAQDRPPRDVCEPLPTEQLDDGVGARVSPDRFGDVAVGVGVAVQHKTHRASHCRQIGMVGRADGGRSRAVEVEREEQPARLQDAADLLNGRCERRDVPEAVPVVTTSQDPDANGSIIMSPTTKLTDPDAPPAPALSRAS